MVRIYDKAALGGTFDRLHVGHEQLLRTALERAERIIVGVTDDNLISDKTLPTIIQPFSIRFHAVQSWLSNHVPKDRYEVIQLVDIYGPTLFDPEIDVLVVTSQTRAGGDLINNKREELELRQLPIIEAEMVLDENEQYVSSTRIRLGQISRQGRVYGDLFQHDIVFTSSSLQVLREIQGKIFHQDMITLERLQTYTEIALVGDVVTKTFIEKQLPFTYAIIDGKTRRNMMMDHMIQSIKLNHNNPAGMITASVAKELFEKISLDQEKIVYHVSGEEDLLAFIPVLTMPLGSAVFYGQPEKGIGMIEVNEATKTHYAKFIDHDFI